MKPAHLYLVILLLSFVSACAVAPSDPWREAARKPIDTGSAVWWDRTKGALK